MDPFGVGQVGPDRALCIGAVTGIAEPGLMEDRIALLDRRRGDPGRGRGLGGGTAGGAGLKNENEPANEAQTAPQIHRVLLCL